MPKNTDDLQASTDKAFLDFLVSEGYINPKKLQDGEWVAIMPLAFTTSVCCGIEEITPYKYRWCFKDPAEAYHFLDNIKDFDEVPEKRESLKGHRYLRAPLYVEKDARGYDKW